MEQTKAQVYKYQEGEAVLEFGFKDDKALKGNKENYLKLLKQAVSDLEKELNEK